MMENNNNVILYIAPWQLLSCHMIIKSFPCLTWKHIIMIKNNSDMSINAMPLLPHALSLESPTCIGLVCLSIFYIMILLSSPWGGFHCMQSQKPRKSVFFLFKKKKEVWLILVCIISYIIYHNIVLYELFWDLWEAYMLLLVYLLSTTKYLDSKNLIGRVCKKDFGP